MSAISQFLDRITEIAYAISPFLKSERLPRTARKIDELVETKSAVIDYILENIESKKTPLYFRHVKELPKKNRLRKQDFLALYEYLKKTGTAEPEREREEEPREEAEKPIIIRCWRDTWNSESSGNAYFGLNLYFAGTEAHLNSIARDMQRIRDIYINVFERWNMGFDYAESDISECSADDHLVEMIEKSGSGFIFEITREMNADWEYYGAWTNRTWSPLHVFAEFPINAVEYCLKTAGIGI